jgi:hypothetical protein
MRLKLHHVQYVARAITRDILNCDFIEIRKDKNSITSVVEKILEDDVERELALDEKVNELLEEQESEIEFYKADYRQLFWLTKKRLANEFGVILSNEDRFSDIAHKILDFLWEEDYVHFVVSDNQVKNVIFNAITRFLKGYEEADSIVFEKIKHYKRKLIPGTEEYNLIYQRLYEEELVRKGLM